MRTYNLAALTALFVAACSGDGDRSPQDGNNASGDQTIDATLASRSDYAEIAGDLPNPERGFTALYTGGSSAPSNPLLVYQVDLGSYCNTATLPASFTQAFTSSLQTLRAQGSKAVVRFDYSPDGNLNTCGYFDAASMSIITGHISQVSSLVAANKDVVAFLQMGWLGRYGEWHDYTDGNPTEASGAGDWVYVAANRQTVVDAALSAFPSDRSISIRTLAYRSGLQESAANMARIGYFDDCFLSSTDDMGTYDANTMKSVQASIATDTLTVPFGGETCDPGSPDTSRFSCTSAVGEMQQLRVTYLNEQYYLGAINGWQSGGCFTTIQNRLGYRYVAKKVGYTATATAGGNVTLQVQVSNTGFAPIYNPRKAVAVLLDSTGAVVQTTVLKTSNDDLRTWAPGQDVIFAQTLQLPAGLAPGTYSYALQLPDASGIAGYAVQLASSCADGATFDTATAVNKLYVSLTVTGA